jgi:precorrin-6A/cobalt-precorrin-6A reductase
MEKKPRILLIAGSAEAHEIAAQIAQTSQKLQAILRRAERSFGPLQVPSQVWTPASVAEMKKFLEDEKIGAICDAGHGFDSDISDLAASAAADLGVPYVRVLRPVWDIADPAERAASVSDAAAMISPGALVFATTGMGTLAGFDPFNGERLFLRQTSRNGRTAVADYVKTVHGTPPFTLEDETALFQLLGIDTLICRNVGGIPGRPKLDAALRLGVRVIVIDRPAPPQGERVLETAGEAVDWIKTL